jgi:hypothetical protein
MSSQQFNLPAEAQPKRSAFATILRCFGFVVCAVVTILFGLVPFVLGVVAQGISPRRIPAYVVGPLGVVLFFALWRLTGWLSFTIGTGIPVWPSVVVSLVLFVPFFASGAALLRELLPRRFLPVSTSSTLQ